jgi:hypothetical protein
MISELVWDFKEMSRALRNTNSTSFAILGVVYRCTYECTVCLVHSLVYVILAMHLY